MRGLEGLCLRRPGRGSGGNPAEAGRLVDAERGVELALAGGGLARLARQQTLRHPLPA